MKRLCSGIITALMIGFVSEAQALTVQRTTSYDINDFLDYTILSEFEYYTSGPMTFGDTVSLRPGDNLLISVEFVSRHSGHPQQIEIIDRTAGRGQSDTEQIDSFLTVHALPPGLHVGWSGRLSLTGLTGDVVQRESSIVASVDFPQGVGSAGLNAGGHIRNFTDTVAAFGGFTAEFALTSLTGAEQLTISNVDLNIYVINDIPGVSPNQIVLRPIPEPSTILLITSAVGLLSWCFYRPFSRGKLKPWNRWKAEVDGRWEIITGLREAGFQ